MTMRESEQLPAAASTQHDLASILRGWARSGGKQVQVVDEHTGWNGHRVRTVRSGALTRKYRRPVLDERLIGVDDVHFVGGQFLADLGDVLVPMPRRKVNIESGPFARGSAAGRVTMNDAPAVFERIGAYLRGEVAYRGEILQVSGRLAELRAKHRGRVPVARLSGFAMVARQVDAAVSAQDAEILAWVSRRSPGRDVDELDVPLAA